MATAFKSCFKSVENNLKNKSEVTKILIFLLVVN